MYGCMDVWMYETESQPFIPKKKTTQVLARLSYLCDITT